MEKVEISLCDLEELKVLVFIRSINNVYVIVELVLKIRLQVLKSDKVTNPATSNFLFSFANSNLNAFFEGASWIGFLLLEHFIEMPVHIVVLMKWNVAKTTNSLFYTLLINKLTEILNFYLSSTTQLILLVCIRSQPVRLVGISNIGAKILLKSHLVDLKAIQFKKTFTLDSDIIIPEMTRNQSSDAHATKPSKSYFRIPKPNMYSDWLKIISKPF